MNFKNLPIGQKMIVIALLQSGMVLLFTCSAFFWYEYVAFRQAMVREYLSLGQIIASNSPAALAFRNRWDAEEILGTLSADPHIVSAALYDEDGQLFSSYSTSEFPNAIPDIPGAEGFHFAHGHLSGFLPVIQSNNRLGTLYLKINQGALYERLTLFGLIAFFVIVASLFVGYLLARKLHKEISDPILSLTGTAKVISEHNDYSVRATKLGDDELGLLTDAFNLMLSQIQIQNRNLGDSERRFRSLVTVTSQIVWTAGPDGQTTGPMASWREYTGQAEKEVRGSGWTRAIHPDDAAEAIEAWTQAIKTKSHYEIEYRIRRHDGEYQYFVVRGVPVVRENGSVYEWVSTCTNIHNRKQAAESIKRFSEELTKSNEELEHFAYVSSHDLQEPLRTISSFAQLLSRRYKDKLDSDADEFIDFIVEGANRMQTLINDLLSFSRVGSRGKPFKPVACEEVLASVTDDLAAAIDETGAEVTHDPLPTVNGDEVQLRQLLQNLIGNSLKFHKPEEAPRIHVSAEREGKGWHFTVRDNGIGIDPGFFDRIFIIFQRLHGRQEFSGTGIGLAVCKKIVERHGGRIWPEANVGIGSTFHFTIPDKHPTL